MSTQHLNVSRGAGEGPPRGAVPSGEDTRGMGTGHKLSSDGHGCLGESEDGQDDGGVHGRDQASEEVPVNQTWSP